MNYFFYAITGLAIILWQTSVQPQIAVFRWMYDLLLTVAVYLGLHRPGREGVPPGSRAAGGGGAGQPPRPPFFLASRANSAACAGC